MLPLHRSWIPAAIACAVAAVASRADAQVTADVGPMVGYYQPYGHFDPASVYSTSLPQRPSDLRGVAWGLTGHVSFGRRLGLEGQFATASSTLPAVITPGGSSGSTSARVTVTTVLGQYDISPAPERVRLWLSAGPGFVQHGGSAYRFYGAPRSLGVAMGGGVALPIASALQVTAGATAVRYSLDVRMPAALRANPGSLQHGMQSDVVMHIGLRWGHT